MTARLLIVLLGPPGSGKGTQAQILAERMNMRHLATGDLLRRHIADGTAIGNLAAEAQACGAYVNDATMIRMIREETRDVGRILLDGFPRTVTQAKALQEMFGDENVHLVPILLEIDPATLTERITGRLVHPDSGRTYHEHLQPPKRAGLDDLTGEPLVRRPDDAPDLVSARLHVYTTKSGPVVDFYEQHGLVRVDASGAPKHVAETLKDAVRRALESRGLHLDGQSTFKG
jgi:adenylate kinase